MASGIPQLQRFFYSHYFFGGLRQSIGILLPILLLGWVFELYDIGMIAAMGALCVAIIDQPGGPRRHRSNEMLGGILLGSITVAITGFASSHPVLIWLAVPIFCFSFSMLTVFGKRGGLVGLACLLLMTLTMHTPLPSQQVLIHTLYSLLGGVFYFIFSFLVSRLLWYREKQQSLSVALFATADYIESRSEFYNINLDLEDCYRRLVRTQLAMIDAQQAARDMILRELPEGRRPRRDRLRTTLLNIFIDMVELLDSLIATHTDYATLRRQLPNSDALVFAQDALYKLSINVRRIALDVSRNKQTTQRSRVKAELRAFEYELELYRRRGLAAEQPEVYALMVQILRRLRTATNVIDRMAEHTHRSTADPAPDANRDKSLSRFLTRDEVRFGMLTSNLRMDSTHFRYALRVAIAAAIGMTLTTLLPLALSHESWARSLTTHSYWIILTIVIVMKPGFAQTRQRNGWRLTGTLLGCGLAFLLFSLTKNLQIYFAVLIAACILGNSLVQINYMLSAVFNTIFVLAGFHFLSPGENFVIGERLLDTFVGCTLALLCSYILPWWEHSFMAPLSRAAKTANQKYLTTGLRYAALSRHLLHVQNLSAPEQSRLDAERNDALTDWQLAHKKVYIAFSNFASAFYRMMDEPAIRQENVPELNNLLLQNHVLASQTGAAIPILATLPKVPDGIQKSLDAIEALLAGNDADAPASIETEGDLAALAYPLRQMVKAAQLIRHEMRGLPASPSTPKPTAGMHRLRKQSE